MSGPAGYLLKPMKLLTYALPQPKTLLAMGLLLLLGFALAQEPPVPRDLLSNRRSVQGDALTFCLNKDLLAAEFNRAVAQAIGESLLSKVNFFEVKPYNPTPPFDYSFPVTEQELLIYLSGECQAFTGFNLSYTAYPEWMTFSRVYAETRFVLATLNPDYQDLSDIPADKAIGTRFVSAVDLKLVNFLQSLPTEKRWQKFSFFNNQILLEKLLDGTVEAVFIWEPALKALKDTPEAEKVRVISTSNFEAPTIQFGMALRSKDTSLRNLLDEAIGSLIQDGTIERLMAENEFPGTPGTASVGSTPTINPLYIGAGAVVVVLLMLWLMRRGRRAGASR